MNEMLKQYALIFGTAMLPLAELRGAIPPGIAMGLAPFPVWLVSVLGNILPAPFIILFIRRVFRWMSLRGGRLAQLVVRMERKAEKGAKLFYRYELLGLFILVAIPLPGTGAWTGALVAAMLNLRLKTAIPAIGLGVLAAGVAVLAISCGAASILA